MSGHHIIDLKYLVGTALALLVLTIITVALAFVHIPTPFNLIVAIGLATFKATLVAAFFMGLVWDKKINTMALVFSMLFFLIFIGITLLDTMFRGDPFWVY